MKKTKSSASIITIPDVALIFDKTRQAVYRWVRPDGKPYEVFTPEDVERLIEEHQEEVDRIKARWALLQSMLPEEN